MSLDFAALFDVSVDDVSPQWLLQRVLESPAVFAGLVKRYGHTWTPKVWSVDTEGTLWGPGCFSIRLHGRTMRLGHSIRFGAFTGDAWHRNELRQVCLVFAGFVGSSRAIYTHELMPTRDPRSEVTDDRGLEEIEAWLRSGIGPPADTFGELHASREYGPRAWYIDTFADLRMPGSGTTTR